MDTAACDDELKWVPHTSSQDELDAWIPDINEISTFDNLFATRLGNLDIVPEITGTYETLKKRAKQIPSFGRNPWVTHIDETLARLTIPRRKKDIAVVSKLREIQRNLGERHNVE